MSAADADAFVASVAAGQPPMALNDVIVYVDLRERKSKTAGIDLAGAVLAAAADEHVHVHVVRAMLDAGDAIVCRIVPTNELQPGTLLPPDRMARIMDDMIRINGVGAATVLAQTPRTPASVTESTISSSSSVSSSSAPAELVLVPVFAYERKTVSDFVASVIPSRGAGGVPSTQRWLDQKARLSAFCQASGCLPAMVLEGYTEHARTGKQLGCMTEAHAHAVLQSANRRDGLPVWNTVGVHDTGRLLLRDACMIQKDRLLPSGWVRLGGIDSLVQRAADGASTLIVRKSEQGTPEAWWRGALCLVPGMSAGKANAVAGKWPSLAALQTAWRNCLTTRQRVALVADVTYSVDDKTKGRRIGPVVSSRLLERMYVSTDAIEDEVYGDESDGEDGGEKRRKKSKK